MNQVQEIQIESALVSRSSIQADVDPGGELAVGKTVSEVPLHAPAGGRGEEYGVPDSLVRVDPR